MLEQDRGASRRPVDHQQLVCVVYLEIGSQVALAFHRRHRQDECLSFLLPAGGVCVASEPKEDQVHFLVLTDICGNRTYGVVAQYYRPLHVGAHSVPRGSVVKDT